MNGNKYEFKRLTATEAAELMEKWKSDSEAYIKSEIDLENAKLRNELLDAFEKAWSRKKYMTDLTFGFKVFDILNSYGFTLHDAADDGIWRYLSLRVVPEVVGRRWGKTADKRFYKEPNRNYLKCEYRYIYLSWQGNYEDTYKILKDNTTDQILNLVDRSGKKGYYVSLYRKMMCWFYRAKKIDSSIGDDEFRRVMVLHTALCTTIEPAFYAGGLDGYIKMIFHKQGISLE